MVPPRKKAQMRRLECCAQTPAILHYLGREHGFEPEGSRNQALAEMFSHQIQDAVLAVRPWMWTILHGEGEEKISESWTNVAVPGFKDTFANFFEKQLKENGTGFLVGNKVVPNREFGR